MADEVKAAGKSTALTDDEDHHEYEEVAEYRVGEGAPPLALVILFAFIVMWAMASWVPFFGY